MNQTVKKILLSILFVLLLIFLVPWLRIAAFLFGFGEPEIWISPLYLGYIITCISLPIAFLLASGKSKKVKYKIWGTILIIPISLPLAYSMGLTYAII